ncbi:MAG: tonB family C-terminal domain protein [Phycisphaerales bacterium]|nr:tonB family C-terminal domain protein [Phycisphaerales bacterium]
MGVLGVAVRELIFHPRDLSFDEDTPRPSPGEPEAELICNSTAFACEGPAMTTPAFARRRPRGIQRASVVSFAIALAVHAGVIGLGLLYYKSVSHYQPPQIVLPKGWATEVDADAGAPSMLLLQPAPPLDIPPPNAPPTPTPKADLGPPPAEFEPPRVASRAAALDAGYGTSSFAPLQILGDNAAAPLVNFNKLPGIGAVLPDPTPPPVTHDRGAGSTDAGAPQGVPDCLPSPSIRNKKPDYPEVAQRQGWTGTVYLELDLNDRGRVTDARLLRSCGHDVLDKSALDAARTWRYTPATLNGRPVAVTVPAPIVYDLQSPRR